MWFGCVHSALRESNCGHIFAAAHNNHGAPAAATPRAPASSPLSTATAHAGHMKPPQSLSARSQAHSFSSDSDALCAHLKRGAASAFVKKPLVRNARRARRVAVTFGSDAARSLCSLASCSTSNRQPLAPQSRTWPWGLFVVELALGKSGPSHPAPACLPSSSLYCPAMSADGPTGTSVRGEVAFAPERSGHCGRRRKAMGGVNE